MGKRVNLGDEIGLPIGVAVRNQSDPAGRDELLESAGEAGDLSLHLDEKARHGRRRVEHEDDVETTFPQRMNVPGKRPDQSFGAGIQGLTAGGWIHPRMIHRRRFEADDVQPFVDLGIGEELWLGCDGPVLDLGKRIHHRLIGAEGIERVRPLELESIVSLALEDDASRFDLSSGWVFTEAPGHSARKNQPRRMNQQ